MASKKARPTWENFMNSGYYNASNIAALQSQLANYNLDLGSLTQQAQAALQPGYNQTVLAANQQLESTLAGYGNQLTGIGMSYDQQRRGTNSQFDQSVSSAMNALTKRGMGRSSVVGTQGAALEAARNQALGDIGLKEADARDDIGRNMALAQSQNGATLRGYAENLTAQAAANAQSMRDSNLQGQTALQGMIAQLRAAAYAAYRAQWDKDHKKSSSGGSPRRSSSTNPPPPKNDDFTRYSNNQNAGQTGAAAGWFSSGVR